MKKAILSIVAGVFSLLVLAQPDVTSAYNANKDGQFAEAAGYIEKAIKDPKASAKEKTWRYRGDIYLNIARTPELSGQFPDAVKLCKESYFKAMELDASKDYIKENTMALSGLQDILLTKAGQQYSAKDFCGAAENFRLTEEISSKFGVIDSAAIFNTAFCLDQCGKPEEALAGYKRSAEIGYNVPSVFAYIAEIHTKAGRADEAKKVISDARAKYPKDAELLRNEVNILIGEQKFDQALELLVALTKADPNNETIWYVLGATYEKLGRVADQETAYRRATELKPDYYDALFNLGATYYNQGVEKLKECDKIPPREAAKYDSCVADANGIFNKSIVEFEKAYAVNPKEKEIMMALKEAYVRVGNIEGQKKMEKELGSK